MKKLILITATIILFLNCNAQVDSLYFGQTPPGNTAEIFAPGIISLAGRWEKKITFSPDGNECYYDAGEIYYIRYENGFLTEQLKESAFDGYTNPTFSLDGKKMYLIKYNSNWTTCNIWVSEKTTGGWNEPYILSEPINSSSMDIGCTETLDSVLYFSSNRSGSWGIWQKNPYSDQSIYLESIVNSSTASDPCIAPDGSYLIFASGRSESIGNGDLYISFNNSNNEWSVPINMEESGAKINLPNHTSVSPFLSSDGKYLFFTRHDDNMENWDIYWVSTSIIDDLRFEANKYFGQTPPGETAIIFAPGIISLTDRTEIGASFSPDSKEFYFSILDENTSKMYYTKYVDNDWTEQKEVGFSNEYNPGAPFFSADGNKIYFASNGDIWMAEHSIEGWGEPQGLLYPINTTSGEYGYSETVDGVVYISSDRTDGIGGVDIWRIPQLSDQAENLGLKVNSSSFEVSPYIAPDESFLIFTSDRPGGYSSNDIYICFKKENNQWTEPLNMERSGAKINIAQHKQYFRSLSPDGKYMFFNRHHNNGGNWDIYWVSTHIIDTLKKIAMPTTLVNQVIDKKVMLYPNPTNGQLTLSLGTSQNHESFVEIYNLQGTRVFSKTFHNTPSATIDLTGYPTGIYVVKVIADGVNYEEKIVKE